MSTAGKALHPNEKFDLGPLGPKIRNAAAAAGVMGLLGAVVLGFLNKDGMQRFFFSYLLSFAYVLSIALGALFFVCIQHLVRSRWSVVIRRVAELLTCGLPALAVLFLVILVPMLMGDHALYKWSNEHLVHQNHLLHEKAGYLNVPFFAIRWVLYFAIWIGAARYFYRTSLEQDKVGGFALSEKMRVAAAPAIMLFAVATCFAAFDLLMSLEPEWFSTMFGVIYFAGCAVSIYALLALVPMWLQKRGLLTHTINVEHYHDVGKLLFAFTFFWAYTSFSQFMLIWYANIPEETYWFQGRMYSDWMWVSLVLLFGHFVFPFVCLMSRHTKRRLSSLRFFAGYMLVMHWFDLFWYVMPAYSPDKVPLHLIDAFTLLGIGGFFFAAVAQAATRAPLLPVKDPRLSASLGFENI
jgi:hypothetical protein